VELADLTNDAGAVRYRMGYDHCKRSGVPWEILYDKTALSANRSGERSGIRRFMRQ
jgi:hypothetical protein